MDFISDDEAIYNVSYSCTALLVDRSCHNRPLTLYSHWLTICGQETGATTAAFVLSFHRTRSTWVMKRWYEIQWSHVTPDNGCNCITIEIVMVTTFHRFLLSYQIFRKVFTSDLYCSTRMNVHCQQMLWQSRRIVKSIHEQLIVLISNAWCNSDNNTTSSTKLLYEETIRLACVNFQIVNVSCWRWPDKMVLDKMARTKW